MAAGSAASISGAAVFSPSVQAFQETEGAVRERICEQAQFVEMGAAKTQTQSEAGPYVLLGDQGVAQSVAGGYHQSQSGQCANPGESLHLTHFAFDGSGSFQRLESLILPRCPNLFGTSLILSKG